MGEHFWCVAQCGDPNNDFRPSRTWRFPNVSSYRLVPGHLGRCFGSTNTRQNTRRIAQTCGVLFGDIRIGSDEVTDAIFAPAEV
jgi:hypothetical protein